MMRTNIFPLIRRHLHAQNNNLLFNRLWITKFSSNNYSTDKNIDQTTKNEQLIKGTYFRLNRFRGIVKCSSIDVLIPEKDRANALHRDIVSVKLSPLSDWLVSLPDSHSLLSVELALWKDPNRLASLGSFDVSKMDLRSTPGLELAQDLKWLKPTGSIVDVLEEINPRLWVGKISSKKDSKGNRLFLPTEDTNSAVLITEDLISESFDASAATEYAHCVVHVKGLPSYIDESDVVDFFNDTEIATNGVEFILDNDGFPTGKANVIFTSSKMRDRALLKNMGKMAQRIIKVVKIDPLEASKTSTQQLTARDNVKYSTNKNIHYLCKLNSYRPKKNPRWTGSIVRAIGDVRDIEPATEVILRNNGIQVEDFSEKLLAELPTSPENFTIPQIELLTREDLRSMCVLTIDPPSAKDLDDAVHIRSVGKNLYEVGVHVADVSYFVKKGSLVDKEASNRANTIYLVQKGSDLYICSKKTDNFLLTPEVIVSLTAFQAIHMLPGVLSEHLCSLNPKQDKLTFSVIFIVNDKGVIQHTRFTRTIIRSCCRLSYKEAQKLISMETEESTSDSEEVNINDFLEVEAPFTPSQVNESVLLLHKIAQNLREKRRDSGAIMIDLGELEFDFPELAEHSNELELIYPTGFYIKTGNLAAQLIEEWMLMANTAVANRLVDGLPRPSRTEDGSNSNEGSLLRQHAPPEVIKIKKLQRSFQDAGITVDPANQDSLTTFLQKIEESNIESKHRCQAISHLTYQMMKMALYFCYESHSNKLSPDDLAKVAHHYGLNVPLYTHFTSPIRRYADIVVHRKLAALIGQENTVEQTANERANAPVTNDDIYSELAQQAELCNSKRLVSKIISDASDELFLAAFIKKCGVINAEATVIDVFRSGTKFYFPEIGFKKSIYFKSIQINDIKFSAKGESKVRIAWPTTAECSHSVSRTFNILDTISCILHCSADRLTIEIEPDRPPCKICDTFQKKKMGHKKQQSQHNILFFSENNERVSEP